MRSLICRLDVIEYKVYMEDSSTMIMIKVVQKKIKKKGALPLAIGKNIPLTYNI